MPGKSSFLDKVLGRIGRLDTEGLQTVVQRLVRERSFLETLFNTIEDGILVVDEHGRILYYNQAVARLLGLQGDVEGEPVTKYFPDLDWESLRSYPFAGLGYHSPNMELSHRAELTRTATGFDQESIATLILSGRFLGFLPDHYAEAFERTGRMQAVQPDQFHYECKFVSMVRRSPTPSRATQAFQDCLARAHAAQR